MPVVSQPTSFAGESEIQGAERSVCVSHQVQRAVHANTMSCPAGDGTYSASSASTTLAVGLQATATSLTVTPSMPVATQPASFAVTLKSAATAMPGLAGKTVIVTYGDGGTDSGTTDANGAVTFTHTYAASVNQDVVASFAGESDVLRGLCVSHQVQRAVHANTVSCPAGDGTYSASSASTTLAVGLQATATSLTVTPSMPVATQPASFAVTLKSAATGTPGLAGQTVTVTYGDGGTDSNTTDANGAVTFTHTYAAFGNPNVVASFAGESDALRGLCVSLTKCRERCTPTPCLVLQVMGPIQHPPHLRHLPSASSPQPPASQSPCRWPPSPPAS